MIRTKKETILNWIVNIILVVTVLMAMFFSITAYVSKTGSGVPSFFGIRPFSVQTQSMEPVLMKGDLIIDHAVKDAAELKEGDIITFWTIIENQRVLNTHRIVRINDNGTYRSFVTKGDNNTAEDYMEVHQSEVVGIYKIRIPQVGKLIDFLKTGKGFFIVIVIPVFLFFVYNVIQFFRALFAYQAAKAKEEFENDDERIKELARKLLEEEKRKKQEEERGEN